MCLFRGSEGRGLISEGDHGNRIYSELYILYLKDFNLKCSNVLLNNNIQRLPWQPNTICKQQYNYNNLQ